MLRNTALFGLALSARCYSFGVFGQKGFQCRSNRFLVRAINGEDTGKRSGATGWNHNLPGPNSDFWKENSAQSLSKQSDPNKEEIRTGWLHNTQSTESMKEKAKSSLSNDMEGAKGVNLARKRLEQAKLEQERNHRMINPPALHPSPDGKTLFAVTEHVVSVPLSYEQAQDIPRLDIYFSIVEVVNTSAKRSFFETSLTNLSPQERAKEYLAHYSPPGSTPTMERSVLYLQGGPGFGAPTPIVGLTTSTSSWLGTILSEPQYDRVVLMDQRGTGRSTPITKQTLQQKFPNLFCLDETEGLSTKPIEEFNSSDTKDLVTAAVEETVAYMTRFRSDSIVKDAEYIRETLLYKPMDDVKNTVTDEPRPWGCSLGQSFGGFCQMSYLSLIPNPPSIMLFTGGIAPMLSDIDNVYSSLWDRVKERSLRFYEQYPGDVDRVKKIVSSLLDSPLTLPSGGKLTARRFLCAGIALGGSPSAFAGLHSLISSAFVPGTFEFSRAFLKEMDMIQAFDDHPIYFWLHESIYANGKDHSPTNWSAHRVYESKVSKQAEFDYRTMCKNQNGSKPVLFFGEHVFPWLAEDFAELNGVGLRAVAESLATKTDWGILFDGDAMKAVLDSGRTRAAAAVYHEDMHVDFDACMKVTARDGPLGKCKLFVTNEYQHSGLRDDGGSIVAKLHRMAKGTTGTPS